MNRSRLSAAAAGLLVVGLTFGATPAAHAKVKAKDVPSKANIVKVFPAFKNGEFITGNKAVVQTPGKKCGTRKTQKVKSAYSRVGTASTSAVVAGVAEFKNKKQAKKAVKKFKKQLKKCKSYTDANGFKVTVKKAKAPKLGQDRVASTQVIKIGGTTTHAATVTIRHGKRVADVTVTGTKKISKKKINKLAKVAAKKMK